MPQPLDLRKDEPHPVSGLAGFAQLRRRLLEDMLLSVDEALQIVQIMHLGSQPVRAGQRLMSQRTRDTTTLTRRLVAIGK